MTPDTGGLPPEGLYVVRLRAVLDVSVGVQALDGASAETEARTVLEAALGAVDMDEHALHGSLESAAVVAVELQ